MMRNVELETVLNNQLNIGAFQDYAPNGLQVEGRRDIQRVVTGVTAVSVAGCGSCASGRCYFSPSWLFLEK